MEPTMTDIAIRKCLHGLGEKTVTERKRQTEALIDLLCDNQTQILIDNNTKEAETKLITWDDLLREIRAHTIKELVTAKSKSTSGLNATQSTTAMARAASSSDIKFIEAMKLFKAFLVYANGRGPQLNSRDLIDCFLGILTSDSWLSCDIVLKELSRIFINDVLSMHKYCCDVKEQEWIDLCELYMSLYKSVDNNSSSSLKTSSFELDRSLYSTYLRTIVEKCVIYSDIELSTTNIREDFIEFLQLEIERMRHSTHFSVLENLLSMLNVWCHKFVYDLPLLILKVGETLFPTILAIWRKKCNENSKNEIIKFCRLQMTLHHPYQADIFDDDYKLNLWMKHLQDISDILLKEIDEICQKQQLTSRQHQNNFEIRSDLLHLSSSVFYQIPYEIVEENNEDIIEPSAKRTRYEYSTSATSVNTTQSSIIENGTQLKCFRRLFQSTDFYHQAAGFQILALQIERSMIISENDCTYYLTVIKRFLTEERRPCLLMNLLRCLLLMLNHKLVKKIDNLLPLIYPLLRQSTCESIVLQILFQSSSLISHDIDLLDISINSLISLQYILCRLIKDGNHNLTTNKKLHLLTKLMFDMEAVYLDSECDQVLTNTIEPTCEYTQIYSQILLQLCSIDLLPMDQSTCCQQASVISDKLEYEWSKRKYLKSFDDKSLQSTMKFKFLSNSNQFVLDSNIFNEFNLKYEKNVKFIINLKDKHPGVHYRLLIHLAFTGVHILNMIQSYFVIDTWNNKESNIYKSLEQITDNIHLLFDELPNETQLILNKKQFLPDYRQSFLHYLHSQILTVTSLLPLSSSLLIPCLTTFNIPHLIYIFLSPKMFVNIYDYLINYSLESADLALIPGVKCPLKNDDLEAHSKSYLLAEEILLSNGLQGIYDLLLLNEQHDRSSLFHHFIISKYSQLTYETTVRFFMKLIDDKLVEHIENIITDALDPFVFRQIFLFLQYFCSCSMIRILWRQSDFDFILDSFHHLFKLYRKDVCTCQILLELFEQFLMNFVFLSKDKLNKSESVIKIKKFIDAFWQIATIKTASEISTLNSASRQIVIRLKQILIEIYNDTTDEETTTVTSRINNDFTTLTCLLSDKSYLVRLTASQLCLDLFYEKYTFSQNDIECELMDVDNNDDNNTLFLYKLIGPYDIKQFDFDKSQQSHNLQFTIEFNRYLWKYRTIYRKLVTSVQQEQIYERLILNKDSIILICLLSKTSKYLERRCMFKLCELIYDKQLTIKECQRICEHLLKHGIDEHMEYIIQTWLDSGYNLKLFPYELLKFKTFGDYFKQYTHLIFPCYFLSNSYEFLVNTITFDQKLYIQKYLPNLLAHILPLMAAGKTNQTEDRIQAEKYQQLIEQLLTKTVYYQLVKQKLTQIVQQLLMTYWNDDNDQLLPEPIRPAYTKEAILKTFEYIKITFFASGTQQNTVKAMSFISLLTKTADINEILLYLSSYLLKTNSIHEQYRLLLILELFLNELLLNLHDLQLLSTSVLRDCTYLLLRYLNVTKNQSIQQYPLWYCELKIKIFDLLSAMLKQLVIMGLEYNSDNYMDYIPDLVLILIDHPSLTRSHIQLLIEQIYDFIKSKRTSIPLMNCLCFLIERENYRKYCPNIRINLVDFLDLINKTTPVKWLLTLFLQEINDAYVKGNEQSINTQSLNTIENVKCKLIKCISGNDRQLSTLAGKCLAKLNCFSSSKSCYDIDDQDDDSFNTIPLWILNDLTSSYLIDPNQFVVECSNRTARNLLLIDVGQELLKAHKENSNVVHYLQPFISQKKGVVTSALSEISTIDYDNLGILPVVHMASAESQWSLFNGLTSFKQWLNSIVDYLLLELKHNQVESGHKYAQVFIQLGQLCRLKIQLTKKLFPYLIYSLLLLPKNTNLQQNLSKHIQTLCEQLLSVAYNKQQQQQQEQNENQMSKSDYSQIASVLFRTINFLRQCHRNATAISTSTSTRSSNSSHTDNSNVTTTILNFENNFWLDLDYFQMAKCALAYNVNRSALIYVELWTTTQRSSLDTNDCSRQLYYSDLDLVHKINNSHPYRHDLIQMCVQLYSNLNEFDGFYGLEKNLSSLMEKPTGLHAVFEQVNNHWNESLFLQDQAAASNAKSSPSKIIQSLRLCGFNHLLEHYLNNLSTTIPTESKRTLYRIQLTSLLSTTKWEETKNLHSWHSESRQLNSSSIHDDILSLMYRQTKVPQLSTPILKLDLWSKLFDQYSTLKEKQQNSDCDLIRDCRLINVIDDCKESKLDSLPKLWLTYVDNDFDRNDELLLTRTAALVTLVQENNENILMKRTLLSNLVSLLCQNALDSKKLQLCERYINDFSSLFGAEGDHSILYLRGKVLCLRKMETSGEYLRQLIQHLSLSVNSSSINILRVKCQLLLCDWLLETRSDTPLSIRLQLEQIITDVEKQQGSSAEYAQVNFQSYLAMARFSDQEYERIDSLIKSAAYEGKRNLLHQSELEYEKVNKIEQGGKYARVLQRNLQLDKKELETIEQQRQVYLTLSLENYLKCLKLFSIHPSSSPLKKDKHRQIATTNQTSQSATTAATVLTNSAPEIMIASKCYSLWVKNIDKDGINSKMSEYLHDIPTHFFLPFVYQMAARMNLTGVSESSKKHSFYSILFSYLYRCVQDHPHHVLPVIFALANAHKDENIIQQQQQTGKGKQSHVVQLNDDLSSTDQRSKAAHSLIEKYSKTKPHMVDQMRKLNDAYIELANFDLQPGQKEKQNGTIYPLPKTLRLMQIQNYEHVAVPTVTIPVSLDCHYDKIPYVVRFEPKCRFVGGVNLPKRIQVLSSTGILLSQLVKGRDDLRQDAVMQQLFTVCNRLLAKDDLTRSKQLQIRTYKVVPLTQKSGVLQWCEGTITLGDYLCNLHTPGGAHQRYHPHDWPISDCRKKLQKVQNLTYEERAKVFMEICQHIKPVFRYFFFEYYPNATIWYNRKMAYAKSVATSSIVGYIVGLGDRHVQNILIDTQIGEVIHIDLGVAFDQGKILPVPETVPFRLSRDVIDGLGMCGTEGLFKKSCECTLELMRQYSDTILTIIEVFLYDPLYQWQISPQKAFHLQQQQRSTADTDQTINSTMQTPSRNGKGHTTYITTTNVNTIAKTVNEGTTDTNKLAERLLIGLRQKLQGFEGILQMTIKAHVNMLINEATSVENLSRLFAGWQPYL